MTTDLTTKAIVKMVILVVIFHLCLITLMKAQGGNAQPQQVSMYKEIATMDSVLFNAFNTRDTTLFKSMFADDLEFYHDKGGLTGLEQTLQFMRSTAKANNGLRRDLVQGSLEVYPVPGYGAIETGSHTFCHTENGKRECGTFKFVHVWQKKNNTWKITRVVSYDH